MDGRRCGPGAAGGRAAPRLGGRRRGPSGAAAAAPAAAVASGWGGGCVSPALWERGRGGTGSREPLSRGEKPVGNQSSPQDNPPPHPFFPSSPGRNAYSAAGAKTLRSAPLWDAAPLRALKPHRLVGCVRPQHEGRRQPAGGGCRLLGHTRIAKKYRWFCAEKLPASDQCFCSAIVCTILLALLLV